jgi:uncharacterized protein YndB with AHSA1/START domain
MADEYDGIVQREIVTTRVFDAPRALVFEAWTDPEQLKQWWGPRGFSNTFRVFEMKPGGMWSYTMHGPDGKEFSNESRFVEIVVPERIVLDHLSAPRFRLTALFEELGDRTKLTFRQLFETSSVYESVKRFAVQGNEENLDRLASFVAEMRAQEYGGVASMSARSRA